MKLYKVIKCSKCPDCQYDPELGKVVCRTCFNRPIDLDDLKTPFPDWCPLVDTGDELPLMQLEQIFLSVRKQIHESGHELYESIQNDSLQNLVSEIMALNEDYVLTHPHTNGSVEIVSTGFTCNQKKFIKQLIELFNLPPVEDRMYRDCNLCFGYHEAKNGLHHCSVFDTLCCIARGGGDTCESHMTPDEYQRATYLRRL